MRKIVVDDIEVEVPDDYSVLQACEEAGAEIPRFCFHERLSVAGNCRMCLVEAKGAPKPIASCAYGVKDLRPGPNGEPPVIETRSDVVKKAREGVMEFLLINHPLDCPICDQGGECDLQDQAMYYGVDSSRYVENKRAVEDKYIGPLVKTIMTRCIHCTRCVRFTTEVAGVSELGATGRGEDMEITTYLEHAMTSEMQGNVIDLCPVGALTSRPYAYQARPWELTKTETIDVMDALGSNIRVDARGREVLRIMPRLNEEVNEEWISDKSRFHWDGLKAQRLDRAFIRKEGKLVPTSWNEAFEAIATKVNATDKSKIAGVSGNLLSLEDQFAFKAFMSNLGSNVIEGRNGVNIDPSLGRGSYLFNSTIAGIEDADALLLIGVNPREDATVLNARIRKRWRQGEFPIAVIGDDVDLTYDFEHIGIGTDSLNDLFAGKHSFAKTLENAKRPMIILGEGAAQAGDINEIIAAISNFAASLQGDDGWNAYNFLHRSASSVGALELGLVFDGGIDAINNAKYDFVFNYAADDSGYEKSEGSFEVYIGSHGDKGAHSADVILPAAAYTEKSGLYINTEGRVQRGLRASFPPGEAKEDWSIFRALSAIVGSPLSFDSFDQLRNALYQEYADLNQIDALLPVVESTESGDKVTKISGKGIFGSGLDSYFLSNPICRASAIMADCASLKQTTQIAAE